MTSAIGTAVVACSAAAGLDFLPTVGRGAAMDAFRAGTVSGAGVRDRGPASFRSSSVGAFIEAYGFGSSGPLSGHLPQPSEIRLRLIHPPRRGPLSGEGPP